MILYIFCDNLYQQPQIETLLRPSINHYLITHNLTVSGATVSTTVTSPVANISLNGVPSGHYYVTVAAVNVIGLGERNLEFITGMYVNQLYYSHF